MDIFAKRNDLELNNSIVIIEEVKLMSQMLFYKFSKSQQTEYKKWVRVRESIIHVHVLVHVADLNATSPKFRKKMLA